MTSTDVRGSLRVLSAVVGASVVVTMGAVTVAYSGNEGDTSTASTNGWAVATLTVTTAPSALETPGASPTFKAIPCPKGRLCHAPANSCRNFDHRWGLAKREPLSAALGTARIIIGSPTTATFSMTSSAL